MYLQNIAFVVQRIGIESEEKHLKPVNVEIQLHVYQILSHQVRSKLTTPTPSQNGPKSSWAGVMVRTKRFLRWFLGICRTLDAVAISIGKDEPALPFFIQMSGRVRVEGVPISDPVLRY